MSYRFTILIILCAGVICSCSRLPFLGTSQPWIQTQTPTTANTPTPSQTPHPSLTPTSTAVPPEIAEPAKQSYHAIFSIQMNTHHVAEVVERIRSGEFIGYDRYFAMLAVLAGVEGVQRSIPEIMPPGPLLQPWDIAVDVHEQTREIIRAWFNDEIGLVDVGQGIAPLIDEVDDVFLEVEQVMFEDFNFDPDVLNLERERVLDSIPGILKKREPSRLE